MKKISFILIISFLFFSLSSCIPSIGINDRLLISAIGIDYENNKYNLTMEYININSQDEQGEKEIISSTGDTIIDGLKNAEKKYGKSLFYSHNKIIIIGDSIITDKIKSIKPLFTGNYATRANTEIFYFSQKAANLIINKKYDLNLLPDITQANGNKCTLLDLVNSLNDDYFSILIPQIKIDENNCTVDTSVLTDGVKQKIISKENTQSVNLLKGKISKNNFLIEVDNNKISVDVKDIKEKIEYDGENFIIKINGQSSLNEKSFNNTEDKKLIEKSQIELNKLIKNNIEKSIEELIKKNDFDPMNFYKYFRKYDYNIFKQNKNNWINFLKNSSFIIESNVYINRIGLEVL